MAYHTLTWLMWLAAAVYVALVNQQPLQSVALILATGTVFTPVSRHSPSGQNWRTFLRFGLWVWLVALAFNLLSAHAGEMVLFALPRKWPLIGGPITLEAMLYGLASGASLFAVMLVFATFNLAVDSHRLLRWIPAGLFQAGVIVSIALGFVPQMIATLRDIREAQRVRGHQVRGLKDLIPLFVPLVTLALERSLRLAESMEARGFGGVTNQGAPAIRHLLQMTTLAGLLALLTGLIGRAANPQAQAATLACLGLGIALTLVTLYAQGRQVKRTHYRRELWQPRDTLASLACSVSILIVAAAHAKNPQTLSYYPYPPFSPWPTFSPLLGIAILLTAAPAFLWVTRQSPHPAFKPVLGEQKSASREAGCPAGNVPTSSDDPSLDCRG
jgi:energy-coupling factor transport system permease protein